MKFAAKYSTDQWAEARRLRAEGLSYAAIAQRVGFKTATSISARARKEGWSGSENTGVAALASVASVAALAKGKPRGASPATAPIRRALALRLYTFIEFEIRMMELRMKKQLDAYEQSPDDKEPPVVTKEQRESFAAGRGRPGRHNPGNLGARPRHGLARAQAANHEPVKQVPPAQPLAHPPGPPV